MITKMLCRISLNRSSKSCTNLQTNRIHSLPHIKTQTHIKSIIQANSITKSQSRFNSTPAIQTNQKHIRIPKLLHSKSRAKSQNELHNTNLIHSRQKREFSGETQDINMVTALNEALRITLSEDESACIFGEDVAFGGVFRATQNLKNEFGEHRVFNSPLSEQGIIGFGIGLAAVGYTSIAEIQFADYIFPAFDQIVNEGAKFRYRCAGDWDCGKLTIRTASAAVGHGALYHSQSPESYFAHCPGLKLVYPRGPYTAKGLLRASIKDQNPVIFFEPKRCYAFPKEAVPIDDFEIPLGKAEILQSGSDVTFIGWGALLQQMKEACDLAKEKDGISVELIDLQTILPFDEETIVNSVKKTGRAVISHEATLTQGFGAELAATIQEKCFLHLEAPVQRVCGADVPAIPLIFERFFIPNKFKMYEAIKLVVDY